MRIVPKYIFVWLMIMVLLVLKLFVSSHPLKLEGILCIYVFLLHEVQAEYHFAMFFYMLENKQLTFNTLLLMIFCLCYFSCYNMVAKFYCQYYIFCAHVWSRLCWCMSMLYIVWSRLCWCMSPQKLLFCYHLPTRGRAGVKLGNAWYVSNISIIFDAPCLFIHHLLCVLFTLRGDFMHFLELTY
jgi:hypothetical protein